MFLFTEQNFIIYFSVIVVFLLMPVTLLYQSTHAVFSRDENRKASAWKQSCSVLKSAISLNTTAIPTANAINNKKTLTRLTYRKTCCNITYMFSYIISCCALMSDYRIIRFTGSITISKMALCSYSTNTEYRHDPVHNSSLDRSSPNRCTIQHLQLDSFGYGMPDLDNYRVKLSINYAVSICWNQSIRHFTVPISVYQ